MSGSASADFEEFIVGTFPCTLDYEKYILSRDTKKKYTIYMLYFYTTHTHIYIYTIVQMYDACVVCVCACMRWVTNKLVLQRCHIAGPGFLLSGFSAAQVVFFFSFVIGLVFLVLLRFLVGCAWPLAGHGFVFCSGNDSPESAPTSD